MKKIIVAAGLLALTYIATAQPGIELGLNMANVKIPNYTTNVRAAGRIGILADMMLSDHFYFQPGIYYAMNGFKTNYISNVNLAGYTDLFKINAIEIPLNIQYKFRQQGLNRFFVGAGLFGGYNVIGREKIQSSERAIKFGQEGEFKAFDWGVSFNGGYEMANGLFFRARYQAGLADINESERTYFPSFRMRSISYGIQVGYIRGRHRTPKAKPDQG